MADKASKARKTTDVGLPDWAKNPEKYQYKKGLGGGQNKKSTTKTKSGVTRPTPWTPKDVFQVK